MATPATMLLSSPPARVGASGRSRAGRTPASLAQSPAATGVSVFTGPRLALPARQARLHAKVRGRWEDGAVGECAGQAIRGRQPPLALPGRISWPPSRALALDLAPKKAPGARCKPFLPLYVSERTRVDGRARTYIHTLTHTH